MNIHRMNVERFQEEGTFDFSFMHITLDLQELNNQMDNMSDFALKIRPVLS